MLMFILYCFFFNDTATTEIYTLSLHDALPIFCIIQADGLENMRKGAMLVAVQAQDISVEPFPHQPQDFSVLEVMLSLGRSEEHTSELQSRQYLVCRLLLEKKKQEKHNTDFYNS